MKRSRNDIVNRHRIVGAIIAREAVKPGELTAILTSLLGLATATGDELLIKKKRGAVRAQLESYLIHAAARAEAEGQDS